MIERMMTRMDAEVRSFEIRIEPPSNAMTVGQTRRLPFEYVQPYLSSQPLRIAPWRPPAPPPPSSV